MMEFVEVGITSKNQLTLPKLVRERLDLGSQGRMIFLLEGNEVRVIKKPADILEIGRSFAEGKRVSSKEIRDEIHEDRKRW